MRLPTWNPERFRGCFANEMFDVPICFLDRLVRDRFGERFHQEIANSQLRIIDSCGHMPEVECPDEFASAVLQFFSDVK